MWIQMKTYEIKSEEDFCEVLVRNKIEQLNNIFELKIKDVEKQRVYKENHQEFISIKADMVLLTRKKSNFSISLSRENCKNYFIHFVNIKNEKGERFSSFIDNLSENDRLLLIDGIVMKNSSSFFNNILTIAIRPENNSALILLKCSSLSLEKSVSKIEKNLAQLTGPGCYSLFGNVIKTIKYTDEDFMLLRIQCYDKSCIKTYKYPNFLCELKNISNEDKRTGVRYDFSSNRVDILVKKPCIDFISLVHDQRIVLNNLKVKYSSDLKLFLLHVKGDVNNLRADPIETISVKCLRPPTRYFPIPNDLKLKNKSTKEPISWGSPSISNNRLHVLNRIDSTSEKSSSRHDPIVLYDSSIDDNVNLLSIQDILSPKRVNNRVTDVINDVGDLFCDYMPTKITKFKSQTDNNVHSKQLPISIEHNRHINSYDLSDSSTDDNVNLSPCQYFSTPKRDSNKKTDVSKDIGIVFCKDNNPEPTKITISKSQRVNNAKKYSNMATNLSDEDKYSKKRKISSSSGNSSDLSSNSSCSPLFFKTTSEVSTFSPKNQPKHLPSGNAKMDTKTQCIGPCRLIHIEPSIFDDEVIVSGYCTKCITFIQKSFIKCLNMESRCPKCSDIVHLTFFIKMFFLYGKNYRQATEVCCYGDNAERVIKKLTKKNITLENYLSDQNCRVLLVNTLKAIIINKTKVNIIVCESVADKTSILLSIDTKYVVTN